MEFNHLNPPKLTDVVTQSRREAATRDANRRWPPFCETATRLRSSPPPLGRTGPRTPSRHEAHKARDRTDAADVLPCLAADRIGAPSCCSAGSSDGGRHRRAGVLAAWRMVRQVRELQEQKRVCHWS
jgi:hypothetical protein